MSDPRRISEVQTTQDRAAAAGTNQVAKTNDLYDSEVLQIEEVLQRIQARRDARQHIDLGQFDAWVQEEFHKIGFRVDIKWYHSNVENLKIPEIEILGRVDERFEFDRDRQVSEVTKDILGLGTEGVIKTDKENVSAMLKQVHGHGHGHSHSH